MTDEFDRDARPAAPAFGAGDPVAGRPERPERRVERPEVVKRPPPRWSPDRPAEPASNRSMVVLALAGIGVLALAVRSGTIGAETAVTLGVLVPAIILHEISHGAVALVFGDPTARDAGRLSLNPVRHVDPFGTLVLPALLILSTGTGFGYAKPVPVNPRRMRSPRNHGLLVSLAGPATNLVLALMVALAVRTAVPDLTLAQVADPRAFGDPPLWAHGLVFFGYLNVVLAVFNMIPIPPLDGSALIERALPQRWWPSYLRFRQYSMGLLLILILVVPGDPLGRLFDPALRAWAELLR